MATINFQRTYKLDETFIGTKERATQVLGKYHKIPELFTFNELESSVTFSSERLVPTSSSNRPRVMLLFSNPHPNSILQGMFLSPNSQGKENLFWSVMEGAGWITLPEKDRSPNLLAQICLEASYQGPFELIFYCYYAFPTDYPEDIRRIFGKEYFGQFIKPQAMDEFRKTIQETGVAAVVTFNKGIFNLVSKNQIDLYIESILKGGLIQSQVNGIDRLVHIYLTFPTGWRFQSDYKKFREANLYAIKAAIARGINAPESDNR